MTLIKLRIILSFMSYNTKQKAAVASFFKNHQERCFAPDDVASALPDVPRSTVYRLISHLTEDGTIRKTGTDGRKSVYQYQGAECLGHMHIRCKCCGKTEHLDAASTKDIERIVESSSGFVALESTVFEGLCKECRK